MGVMNVQTESATCRCPAGHRTSAVDELQRHPSQAQPVHQQQHRCHRHQQSEQHTHFNRLAGLDGNFWFSPSLKGEVLLAHTFSPAGVKSDSLGIGRLMFSKRDIVADVRYYAVGPDFVPEMGFVTQNDLRRSSVDAGYTQWINRKRVRNVIYSGSLVYDAFYDHAFLGRRGTAGAELTLESNDRIGYSYGPARERISVPF